MLAPTRPRGSRSAVSHPEQRASGAGYLREITQGVGWLLQGTCVPLSLFIAAVSALFIFWPPVG